MTKRALRSALVVAEAFVLACGLSEAAAQAEKPTSPVPREGCVTAECHPAIKAMPFTHGPVGVNACDACHEETDAAKHAFRMRRTGKDLCAFCHQLSLDEQYVHQPVGEGECVQCHNPHGGGNRFLLKAESQKELCKTCHKDVIGPRRVVHGPVAAGACGACHAPHASKYPKLLAYQGTELCLQCHASIKTLIETSRVIHGPVATDCQACHNAHASDHKMILKDEPKPLCESCHEEIKHTIKTATTQHGAITTQRACLNCHTPHAGDWPAVLKNDMLSLCLECHDKEIELPDGRKLMNMKKVLATGKSLHGPVAQHNCAACHQIHGGSHFRMLMKEYPPEFYAPFKEENYALCFACHDREVVLEEKTTALTDFRNGDTNLHFLHVNKKKKGRTCRACHETHASDKAKHIRNSVPFGAGGWMLPVGFEKLENGGRCAPGCHLPYEYNRIKPVVYEHPATPATWPSPPAESTTQTSAQGATR